MKKTLQSARCKTIKNLSSLLLTLHSNLRLTLVRLLSLGKAFWSISLLEKLHQVSSNITRNISCALKQLFFLVTFFLIFFFSSTNVSSLVDTRFIHQHFVSMCVYVCVCTCVCVQVYRYIILYAYRPYVILP